MANPHSNHHHHPLAAVLLVMFLLLISPPSSSARLLNGFSLAAESTLNLALPSERVVVVQEKEKAVAAGHVSPPCHHHHLRIAAAGKLPLQGTRFAGGKYGPLILNMLPKGTVPPSGPSKGTNSINN